MDISTHSKYLVTPILFYCGPLLHILPLQGYIEIKITVTMYAMNLKVPERQLHLY
jgi:hypothetical protein